MTKKKPRKKELQSAAAMLGRLGGSKSSEAKTAAARENARKSKGVPKKPFDQLSPRYQRILLKRQHQQDNSENN